MDAFSYYYELTDREELKLMPIVGSAELPPRTEPLSDDTKSRVAQHIADNQQALELLHTGAAAEYFRYPVDFGDGIGTLMPHLNELKKGAKLLNLEAVLYAEKGKPQLATDSVISSLGIARSLTKEPMVVSQLVRISCQALNASILEHLINRTDFTDEQLAELSQAVAEADDPAAMARGYVGERCFAIDTFKLPYSKIRHVSSFPSRRPTVGVLSFVLYKATGTKSMDLLIYLDFLDNYIRATQVPLHLRQDAVQAIEAKLTTLSKAHIFLHLFPPTFARYTILDLANVSYLRAAQASLAIQRYRLAIGKIPDTLGDLAPTYLDAVPSDPFDGNDLRYKKLVTGFVVYSIGEDGSDDGGKERPPTRQRTGDAVNYDVTFTVER